MPYPQNQVTVKSSETGDVFRTSRGFAERQDTLTILDDEPTHEPTTKAAHKGAAPVKSVDKPADPIAAPVADDN